MSRKQGKGAPDAETQEQFTSVIDGLKRLYERKIKPIEALYKFDEFYTPFLRDADFEAKPFILLLGQYSVGKTTFINYLLETEWKNAHIGPEPTTDRFMAIMHGNEFRVLPGNTVAVASDQPFTGLQRFGTSFLNKFEVTQLKSDILQSVTFIDTPGVLSGDKQRIGRQYDFETVCEWFAGRADRILLLFDAYKLDISDEFKRVVESLRGHEDKIRIVLNKADQVDPQQLMRVYGALMWSLGKVVNSPEVSRVYIGSFWPEEYRFAGLAGLFDAEEADLLGDLKTLPRMNAVRKVNEIVKRARLVKVHALIIAHLRNEMPSVFGKDSKKQTLISGLAEEFKKVHIKYNLPVGDFPPVQRMQEKLENYDFNKLPKLNEKMLAEMDAVLSEDIPRLMKQFPQDTM
jgi:GTP-binding protein EngB required for normal cell division